MTTLLFILALLLMQRETPQSSWAASLPTTPQVSSQEKPTDNRAVAQATKPTTKDRTGFKNLSGLPTAAANQKSGFLKLKSEIKTTQDSSFYKKLATTFSLFTQATSPEKVYLQFDRLFFEPGEAIWFNAYVRDANTLKASPKSEILYVELLGPNGSVLKKITLLAKGGTAAGDFQLDAAAAGGRYKIRAYTNWMRNANDAFERDVQVQATVLPRLRMELDFMKKAYGPGDVVEAKLDLNTLANSPLAELEFGGTVSLDGQQFTTVSGKTDERGHAKVKFELPKGLETNDGLLNVLIGYNGQTESISRSIPIVLNKIDLQFMPEGGDMVAGLPAVVAFKALNEWGKPADVSGKIVNSKGVEVASFVSYHQGMGAFDFTPASGETYHAVLTKPVLPNSSSAADQSPNWSSAAQLPKVYPRGFSMKINPLQKGTLTVEVNSTEDEVLHVALVCGGELQFAQTLPAHAGSHLVRIPVKNLPIGIAQVTLFDSQELPRAERLVFLNHDKQLKISVKTDKEKYLPREKVTMTVSVTDERGIAMPGQFSLSVADDNLLTFADDRQGHILSHLLLESELKGKVGEPNFYFEPKEKHPEKNELLALDYLMLTQGWRRLAWEEMLDRQPVAMQFENERAVTQGIVTDKNGTPVPRMLVGVKQTGLVAMTDNFGRFELDTLLPRNQPLAVFSTAWEGNQILADGTSKTLQIRLPYEVKDFDKNQIQMAPLVLAKPMQTRLEGTLKDSDTGEPIIFGTVAVYRNGVLKTGTETDFDGYYSISELDPGVYDVEFSYTGYSPSRVTGMEIRNGKINKLDEQMSTGMQLMEVVVKYEKPLIAQDGTTQGNTISMGRPKASAPRNTAKEKKTLGKERAWQPQPDVATGSTLTSDQIKALPTRDVNALASVTGVLSGDDGGELNIRSSRTNGTNYFIDGVRVNGNLPPKQSIEEVQVITNGIEARFGDISAGKRDMNDDVDLLQAQIIANAKAAAGNGIVRNEAVRPEAKMDKDGTWLQNDLKLPASSAYPNAINFQSFHDPRQFYAPKYDTDLVIPEGNLRTDFRKTVFFAPKLEVGRNGRATVEFYNTDAISTFRATVEGISSGGEIGRTEQRFFTQMPFSMDVKAPVNLLTGDKLAFPLALTNNTDKPIQGKLTIEMPAGFERNTDWQSMTPGKTDARNGQRESTDWQSVLLAPGESTTIYPKYEVGFGAKSGTMKVSFEANGQSDAFTQALKVQPRGFPVDLVFGGNDRDKTFSIPVKDVVEGSLSATFTVHPSVLSDLTTGMERMLRQPSGCFEQTSSSNYPNILVLNLLKTTGNANAALENRANAFLDFGYKRLLTFEIPGGGFDWFATPPAHEALTAYGLMEFVDMKSVYPVEQDLIDRTARWLLTRRDGKGGWLASKQGAHSWQQPNPVSNAYITWAMTEAGYGQNVAPEMAKTLADARETQDPYIVALAAKSLLNLNDRRAEEMLAILTKTQATDGSWTGKTMSMTHSTGKNLTVETTALATLAFLANADAAEGGASGAEMAVVNRAVTYLAGAKTQYGFGSTQGTVLALKALVVNARTMKKSIGGEVELFVNGKSVGKQPFTAAERNPLTFNGLEEYFTEGKNEVKVKFADGDALPYDLSVKYATTLPYSNPDCKLTLKTTLGTSTAPQSATRNPKSEIGGTLRLTTSIINRPADAVPNPIAIVGIPAGLSVQPWQLKEMSDRKLFDFYEIKDSYVVFYFRGMGAGEVKNLNLDLKADVPGEYEAPASAAWLYYSNDAVVWSKPERVVIGN
ncbi:MAG: carboxypeptidase regulatory-like domain-containing protein [Saprospiraceae bacterium]|nr:carboxypeptidase regulatory-like domain-containing protein [Saprospiraceae bacterium]